MSKKNEETIAEKLARLGELVAWFESDEFEIEKAAEKFKNAELLASEIEKELGEFKNTITVLKKDFSREA
ncbi:MAG TPA: hypothetical protein VGE34_00505 [Candidatus Saccharimonadales bacterium]